MFQIQVFGVPCLLLMVWNSRMPIVTVFCCPHGYYIDIQIENRVSEFPGLSLNGSVIDDVSHLRILGVTLDCILLFDTHLRTIAASASQKIGILRRSWRIFQDCELLKKCAKCFVVRLLEFCSPVWMAAANCHLNLLDRVMRQCSFMLGDTLSVSLHHRRKVSSLSVFYKMHQKPERYPASCYLPQPFVPVRAISAAASVHRFVLQPSVCRTAQYSRSFVPATVALWNSLENQVFDPQLI